MGAKTENIYCDIEERIFYLSDDIDNVSIGKMNFFLLNLITKDDKEEEVKKDFKRTPVKIYINSYGGSTYDMWSLIDIILNSKTPIYTYCTGYAMSSGFKIFLAGHKRFITKHSTLMYHTLWAARSGKYQDFVEDRNEMDWLNNTIEEYVLEHTNLTKEQVKDIREKKKDFYIHANDAIKLGMADEII